MKLYPINLWNFPLQQRDIMSRIEDQVCRDIQKRASVGLKKYGVTVERDDIDLRGWLQHAYEEVLDGRLATGQSGFRWLEFRVRPLSPMARWNGLTVKVC